MSHRVSVSLRHGKTVQVYEYGDDVIGLILHGRTIFVTPTGAMTIRETSHLVDHPAVSLPALDQPTEGEQFRSIIRSIPVDD